MGYLDNSVTATLVNIKLTDKGRELLAQGFKSDNVFDIVKFSFGDSEVDYRLESSDIDLTRITEPENGAKDLKTKLYASGTIPSGSPVIHSSTEVNMTTYQSDVSINASTQWPPVVGNYVEEYTWTNLGPLADSDFVLYLTTDTRSANVQTLGTTGTTSILIEGKTSGAYTTVALNIT